MEQQQQQSASNKTLMDQGLFIQEVIDLRRSVPLKDDTQELQSSQHIEYSLGTNIYRNPINYADIAGFDATLNHSDAKALSELEAVIEESQRYVYMLYTFRSCAGVLQSVSSTQHGSGGTEEQQKDILNKTIFEIMLPEMRKVKDLMHFQSKAIELFKINVASLLQPNQRKKTISSFVLEAMAHLLDQLITLDFLKDTKSFLKNDFAFYKRSYESVKKMLPDAEQVYEEIAQLQNFLTDPLHNSSTMTSGIL